MPPPRSLGPHFVISPRRSRLHHLHPRPNPHRISSSYPSSHHNHFSTSTPAFFPPSDPPKAENKTNNPSDAARNRGYLSLKEGDLGGGTLPPRRGQGQFGGNKNEGDDEEMRRIQARRALAGGRGAGGVRGRRKPGVGSTGRGGMGGRGLGMGMGMGGRSTRGRMPLGHRRRDDEEEAQEDEVTLLTSFITQIQDILKHCWVVEPPIDPETNQPIEDFDPDQVPTPPEKAKDLDAVPLSPTQYRDFSNLIGLYTQMKEEILATRRRELEEKERELPRHISVLPYSGAVLPSIFGEPAGPTGPNRPPPGLHYPDSSSSDPVGVGLNPSRIRAKSESLTSSNPSSSNSWEAAGKMIRELANSKGSGEAIKSPQFEEFRNLRLEQLSKMKAMSSGRSVGGTSIVGSKSRLSRMGMGKKGGLVGMLDGTKQKRELQASRKAEVKRIADGLREGTIQPEDVGLPPPPKGASRETVAESFVVAYETTNKAFDKYHKLKLKNEKGILRWKAKGDEKLILKMGNQRARRIIRQRKKKKEGNLFKVLEDLAEKFDDSGEATKVQNRMADARAEAIRKGGTREDNDEEGVDQLVKQALNEQQEKEQELLVERLMNRRNESEEVRKEREKWNAIKARAEESRNEEEKGLIDRAWDAVTGFLHLGSSPTESEAEKNETRRQKRAAKAAREHALSLGIGGEHSPKGLMEAFEQEYQQAIKITDRQLEKALEAHQKELNAVQRHEAALKEKEKQGESGATPTSNEQASSKTSPSEGDPADLTDNGDGTKLDPNSVVRESAAAKRVEDLRQQIKMLKWDVKAAVLMHAQQESSTRGTVPGSSSPELPSHLDSTSPIVAKLRAIEAARKVKPPASSYEHHLHISPTSSSFPVPPMPSPSSAAAGSSGPSSKDKSSKSQRSAKKMVKSAAQRQLTPEEAAIARADHALTSNPSLGLYGKRWAVETIKRGVEGKSHRPKNPA